MCICMNLRLHVKYFWVIPVFCPTPLVKDLTEGKTIMFKINYSLTS